eukprot:407014-Alexandrium_andersonii.AAC.1
MSASLVGSEMCIRDRVCLGWQHTARAAPGIPPQDTRWDLLGTRRSRDKPVSYTHLTLPTICSV